MFALVIFDEECFGKAQQRLHINVSLVELTGGASWVIDVPQSSDTPVSAFPWGKVKAEKDCCPPLFCQEFFFFFAVSH